LPQPSLASPCTSKRTPFMSVKPKDWPVCPVSATRMVPSGRPAPPCLLRVRVRVRVRVKVRVRVRVRVKVS
jgi:hypothetical protein